MPSPEILPQEQQLEFLVADNYAEIAEMVADIFEEHGSFVDLEFEERYPVVMSIIDNIALSYMNGEAPSDDLYRALYQAFYFAYTASRSVTATEYPGVAVSDYYNQTTEELFDAMQRDAEEYLLVRPAINGLIYAFLGSIDQSRTYGESARIVAAITFSQIEADEREQYIAESLAEFALDFKNTNL